MHDISIHKVLIKICLSLKYRFGEVEVFGAKYMTVSIKTDMSSKILFCNSRFIPNARFHFEMCKVSLNYIY